MGDRREWRCGGEGGDGARSIEVSWELFLSSMNLCR